MSKIKVGVIGVGQMGTYHAQIYQKLPQVELCALCEFNDDRRSELATEFPGITLYKDYKELLKDAAIEAVSIVLPDNLHREAVELAVQAGKHIPVSYTHLFGLVSACQPVYSEACRGL